ncbi:hypothetical protein SAMN05444678_12312 [Sphingomonas sp. YR710]|nr:hypothetical protein SAMN05444678_12312 [Sphingomonas sp. YR710]
MFDHTGEFGRPLAEWDRTGADLRGYMSSVYLRMAGGIAISGFASWLVSYDPALARILFTENGLTGIGWVVTIAPLGLVLLLSTAIDRLSATAAGAIFMSYAALVGLSLGDLALVYTGANLATTFLGAAAGFIALAWVGSMTRRDLSGIVSFLTVGLVGLIVAMLVNLFVRSARFDFILSITGIFLFAGFTVSDAQRLKHLYLEAATDGRNRLAVIGALTLYLDFLNIFLFLLRFSAQRRR